MNPTSRDEVTRAGDREELVAHLIGRSDFAAVLRELDAWAGEGDPSPGDAAGIAYYRALALFGLSRYSDALAAARSAFLFYNRSVDHLRLAEVLTVLGKAYAGIGDLKNARIQIRNALAAFFRVGHIDGIIRSYNELARIEFIRGELELAVDHLSEAIAHCRQEGDVALRAKLVGNLGRIHLLRAAWQDAKECFELAIRTHSRLGNELSVARNLLSMGLLYARQGAFGVADATLNEAAAIIERNGWRRERSILHEYRGISALLSGDFTRAEAEFNQALELGRQVAQRSDLVSQSLRGLAEVYLEQGEVTAAEKTALEALDIASELGEKTEIGAAHRVLGRFYAARNNSTQARQHFELSLALLRAVGDVFEMAWTSFYQTQYLIDSAEPPDRVVARAALAECEARFSALGGSFWSDLPLMLRAALELSEGNLAAAGRIISQLTDRDAEAARPTWLFSRQLSGLRQKWETLLAEHAAGEQNEYRIFRAALSEGEVRGLRGNFDDCVRLLISRLAADGAAIVLAHPETDEAECVYAHQLSDERRRRLVRLAGGGPFSVFPLDRPSVISHLPDQPKIEEFLNRNDDRPTRAVLTIPVNLGLEGRGLLYLDRRTNGVRPPVFSPADVDFAVAFAEVLALKFAERQRSGLLEDNRRLKAQLNEKVGFPSIVTASEKMIEMLSRVRLVMDSNVTVLLQGETGTGKDLLAKAIHYNSSRRECSFVSVNCAALPESLLESELFGYRKGSFTGADRDKKGLFEEADGGTFFLDEIGDLPLVLQAKLLRFLEEKEIVRLGETRPRKVDVRVISATNRYLKTDTDRGLFRQDLYYRLSALSFTIPPLRDRREDIPLLTEHFLGKGISDGEPSPVLAPETLRRLVEYDWPGNVRELENEIKKLVLLGAQTGEIGAELLARKFHEAGTERDDVPPDNGRFLLYEHLAAIEKKHLLRALAESRWVKKHAADRLGIPESTLRLKMQQYKLDRQKK